MAPTKLTRFGEFAASLFERKVTTREIKSARSRERWKYTLEHLIAGTAGVPGFGEMFVDQIQVAHVLSWKTGIAKLIGAGHYSPSTANGWLAILRVITKAAKRVTPRAVCIAVCISNAYHLGRRAVR